MSKSVRVAIIGGGIAGVGLLYHLAKAGWSDTVLFEKAELTSGSTWHAAGQCAHFVPDYNLAKMNDYGIKLYPELEKETGQQVNWHACGGLRVASSEEEMEWFRYAKGIADSLDIRMDLISPEEIQKRCPHYMVDGVLGAAWTYDDGHIDPTSLTNALAIGARNRGAAIKRRCQVTGLSQKPSGEWEVETEDGTYTAEHVVIAAGCYSKVVGDWIGLDVPIRNMKHRYLVTEEVPEFAASDTELPVIRDTYAAGYIRQEQKSGLIGVYEKEGAEHTWFPGPPWESESELFDENLDPIMPWLERALKRMPILAELGIKRVVNGAITHTPDGNPLIGPAARFKNLWLSTGFSIGVAQGCGAGQALAQWITEGKCDLNMHSFDPRRFGPYLTDDAITERTHYDIHHMFAVHTPGENRFAGREMRKSGLYERLIAKRAIHGEVFGWERPKWFVPDEMPLEDQVSLTRSGWFDPVAAECKAVREAAGIMDISSFAKFDVTGPDAAAFLDRILANKLPKKDGGIALAHMLCPQGRIQSEVTVTRLASDRFFVLTGAAAEIHDYDWMMAQIMDEDVTITNVTDAFGAVALAGPNSRAILAGLTEADLGNAGFRWLSGQEIGIAGIPVRALRMTYVGELGWELHAPMDQIGALYDALVEAGESHGLRDFGAHAMNVLRMEKAYRGYGAELTNEISLIEANMERFAALGKGEFTGRAALQNIQQKGVSQRLVYLRVDTGDADPIGGEPVMQNGQPVGITTSGAYGHTVGHGLAFAYVVADKFDETAPFTITIQSRDCPASVLSEPAYDPQSTRPRVDA